MPAPRDSAGAPHYAADLLPIIDDNVALILDEDDLAPPTPAPAQGKGKGKGREVDAPPPLLSREEIPHTAKIVAACSGAVLTSLLMTPFDVVKVRLQTQPTSAPLFTPSASPSTSASASSSRSCCQRTYFTHNLSPSLICIHDPRSTPPIPPSPRTSPRSVPRAHPWPSNHKSSRRPPRVGRSGTAGVSTACAFASRGDAVRALAGSAEVRRVNGTWDAVRKIWKYEGMVGMWKGLTPTLVMAVPSQALYMLGYETLHHRLLSAPFSLSPTLSPLLAGALARTASATLISPIELLRTRLQASNAPAFPLVLLGIRDMVRREGVRSLWRGLGWTLARDVPFSAAYWTGYEMIKKGLIKLESRDAGVRTAFISGALSGTISALLTSPFDVLKTRRQTYLSSSAVSIEARPPPMHRALLDIVRREGVSALYAGVTPRVAKVAPACGLMIGAYEGVGRWVARKMERSGREGETGGWR